MINEILWFELLIGCFLLIMLAYTLWGKTGLYAWVAIAIIVANIQVMKTIEFFGFVTSMGNIVYGSLFLVTDILSEVHSKKDAQRAVWIGFYVLIAVTLIMQLTLFFVPHESDFLSPHMAAIFSLLPRIAFASLTAYFISQFHDVWIFAKMKKRFKGRFLWVRNNTSTMLSQLLDNMIFTLIAFVGVFSWSIILQIFFTSYVMKIVVAACDTPFVYWAKKMRAKH